MDLWSSVRQICPAKIETARLLSQIISVIRNTLVSVYAEAEQAGSNGNIGLGCAVVYHLCHEQVERRYSHTQAEEVEQRGYAVAAEHI